MLRADVPALILAPMEGVTDAPMRAVQGEIGAFTFAVSEFLRINHATPPKSVFFRHIPELRNDCLTANGLPVVVQILGGDASIMAESAVFAHSLGAKVIDINFGCPAKTVNRHDGGATLLKYPTRIREIVRAVRDALPRDVPVSAKLRLGWDDIDAIHENADMAEEGGASWITIHGRTREAGYAPPIYWSPIGQVRERLSIPVVANGDIWTIEGFRQCREETRCEHFMLGRGALANPVLSQQVAHELGIGSSFPSDLDESFDWTIPLQRLADWTTTFPDLEAVHTVHRMKQWLHMASKYGKFRHFDVVKRVKDSHELYEVLRAVTLQPQ